MIPVYTNVKEAARLQRVSVRELERICGLSTGSVAKWNVVSPTVNNLKKVADALGLPVDALLKE